MRGAEFRLAVVGLGYVGLPLAVAFGSKMPVIGYDIDKERVKELQDGVDHTLEVSSEELATSGQLGFTDSIDDIRESDVYIITVPTPIDSARRPDFDPLLRSSAAIGSLLKKGDVVIYESTVYPGVTEEVCVPVLEKESGLVFNKDFFCGYSPERINPGDRDHRRVERHRRSACARVGAALGGKGVKPNSTARSRQAGLSISISSSFHARFHFLSRFSRTIACSIVACGSNQTSILMPYLRVKPGMTPSRC